MSYSPRRAEVRFGCGLSPSVVPAGDAAAFLDRLKQPDEAARRFPVETFDEFRVRIAEQREMMAEARATGTRNKAARDARRARRKLRRRRSVRPRSPSFAPSCTTTVRHA